MNLIGLAFGLQVVAHENAREYLGILPSSSNTPPFLFLSHPFCHMQTIPWSVVIRQTSRYSQLFVATLHPVCGCLRSIGDAVRIFGKRTCFLRPSTSVNIGRTSSEATVYLVHRQGVEPIIPISALNFLAITMVLPIYSYVSHRTRSNGSSSFFGSTNSN